MLIGIDPLLSGPLLNILRSMGHGQTLAITDCNFPAWFQGPPVIQTDTDIVAIGRAILSVFPLDSFVPHALHRMEVIDAPDELTEAHLAFLAMAQEVAGPRWTMGSYERFRFYENARGCVAIVATLDRRAYANIILTKGVITPDGSVR
jgi:L-fucose mutarotase